ncbi:MAG: alpha/beta fold hydrolase [Lentisphaerae bacterium]|jgi:pimeloyl-ACP methyl ester carboxylesterase|nr:alpha/beta fold hydrolase [Lentisphaerota bacterium]MBT4817779.1 alpha/beta fold hydrolase [Lentisphaerota bacterium]MBT5610888.1 alpha/beta fold hydrolase [Lentisphaerota bacterium]MBT7060655.1 alpha/beta fold hydrolase [Lentisphaerota bacterium]MBT7846720.1 alpha/beta fold hydrolase [Lentisphaerota bacterium]
MTLDDQAISRALFHPRGEALGHVSPGIRTETQCGSAIVGGYLHLNPTSDVLMLFFHGNGEIAADYDSLSRLFTQCGTSYWVVDYRRYGRSTGAPSLPHMLADAEVCLNDIPRISQLAGKPFRHILIMGRSLGSAPAIHLAATATDKLAGLILDSPYADGPALIRRLGGPVVSRSDFPASSDNLGKMRQCDLPALIIHGTDDHIIPFSDSEALLDACPCPEKKLLSIEGAGHNDLLVHGLDQYCTAIREHIASAAV